MNYAAGASYPGVERSWRALAALTGNDGTATIATSPVQIAEVIDAHTGREEYERKVAGHLFAIGRELGAGGPTAGVADGTSAQLKSRLSDLIGALEQPTLERLLLFAGGPGERLEAVTDLSTVAESGALVRLVRAASEVLDEDISEWQARLLVKMSTLAVDAGEDGEPTAARALRSVVRAILKQWVLESEHLDASEALLRRLMSSTAGDELEDAPVTAVDAERILQTSMEIGECGQLALRSLQALQHRGELALAIDILHRSPGDGKPLKRLWRQIATAETIGYLLAQDPPDFDRLDILLPRVGSDAAGPMLRMLADCESRPARQRLLERLTGFGGILLPLVMEWLADERWYVKRNMLLLLQELGNWPEGIVDADPFLTHPHEAVRQEAVKLFLDVPSHRDAALRVALEDGDHSIRALGLTAAAESCPAWAVPRLAQLLRRSELTPEDRLMTIRALGASGQEAALVALVDSVLVRRLGIFRRRLAETSPELLLAIELIGQGWGSDPRSLKVLALAEASEDSTVREAARSGGDRR